MSRHPILLAMILALFAGSCERPTSQRTIAYFPGRPIAERLVPGDKQVLVEMKASTAPLPPPPASFEQEIESLRRSEIIVLLRVGGTSGAIADQGTWIRTTVNAGVDRIVKAPVDRSLGESIAFTFSGGTAKLGDVVVTTGKFPQFTDGERYLVFLMTRPGNRSSLTWAGVGFRVDAAGTLQRIAINDGSEQTFPTHLIGRDVSDVMGALAR